MNALTWATIKDAAKAPSDMYCPTRDIADARLPKLLTAAQAAGLDEASSALLAAVAGEIIANSFDHNIGSWSDIPGCWFEVAPKERLIEIIIADRGQGFLQTLRHADESIVTHAQAIKVAFTKVISGRAPERRGRGLKFVLSAFNETFPGATIEVVTGNAKLRAVSPVSPEELHLYVSEENMPVSGVYVKLQIPV